jgi:hypothetical protein
MKRFVLILLILLLTGCSYVFEQSVQRRYAESRGECEELTIMKIGMLSQNHNPAKNISRKKLEFFSDCMHAKGWAVAKPPPEEGDDEIVKILEQNEIVGGGTLNIIGNNAGVGFK